MRIDLLHVPECPNLERARARLDAVLATSGITAAVRVVEVATPDDAERTGLRGSPTILVDGRDVVAGPADASLSCRLYATPDGVDGAPTVAQLVAAISAG